MLSAVVIELPQRAPRVRFKHPVRVVPLDGSPRIYRTLTANLSRKGMFVRMPEPLPKGTRVALSLEAAGQALPFAEAEVAWCRTSESQLPGRYTGFGVRFTSFLNPRAPELVEYLVKNLDRGRPLKLAPPKPARNRRRIGLAAGVLALVVSGGLGARAVLHGAAEDDAFATLEVSSAPVAVAEATPVAMPLEPVIAPPSPVAAAAPEPSSAVAAAARDVAPSAAPEPSSAVAAAAPDVAPAADPEPPSPVVAAKPDVAPVAESEPSPISEPLPSPPAAGAIAAPPPRAAAVADSTPTPALASAPKSALVDAAPAPKTAGAPGRTSSSDAKAAPAKVAPAGDGPAQQPATAKSKPAQGRLALPSGAAQSLSWEERGDAVHVGLALAPGVTVGRRFLLAGPPRLVMDLDGRAPKKSLTLEAKAPWLKQVRIGPHGASTRVVVDLASAPAAMTQGDDGVTLTFAH